MSGMNKWLAPANDILSGWPRWINDWLGLMRPKRIAGFGSYELVSRIDAFMCTMFCIYQVYERTTILML
jgi:hypothetical protein